MWPTIQESASDQIQIQIQGGKGVGRRTLAAVVTLDPGIVPRLGTILAKMAAFVAVAAGYGRHVAWLVAVASHVLFGSIRH